MDLANILAELKAVQDDFKHSDKAFATATFCQRTCKVLDNIVKGTENEEFENLVVGIWIVISSVNDLLPLLIDGPLLTELAEKLFRQCARVVLDIKWQQLDPSEQSRQNLENSLTICHQYMAPRGFTRFGVVNALMAEPWTDPTLTMVMGSEEDNEKGEGLAYIRAQDPEILKLRVDLMYQENCDEFALNLCFWCLKHPALAADFTLHKTQFILLHRLGYIDRLQEECQTMGLVDSIRLINSLHGREEHKELCTVLAQTFLVQNWIKPSDNNSKMELLRLWIRLQCQDDEDQDNFISNLWAVAKVSRSTEQLLFIIDAVREKCGDTFLQFYLDLCIFAINVDKGCWEKLKESPKTGPNEELMARKRDMAQVCDKLAHIVSHVSPKVAFCCALTSFTMMPSEQSMQAMREAHQRKSRAELSSKSLCCSNCAADQGVCLKNEDRDKASRDVNVATLYEVERLCSILRPSYFSCDSDLPSLLSLCKQHQLKEKGEVVESTLVQRSPLPAGQEAPPAVSGGKIVVQETKPIHMQQKSPMRKTVDASSNVSNVAIPSSTGSLHSVGHGVGGRETTAQQLNRSVAASNEIIQRLVLQQLPSDIVQTLLYLIHSNRVSPVQLNYIMTKNPERSIPILRNLVTQMKEADALRLEIDQQSQQQQQAQHSSQMEQKPLLKPPAVQQQPKGEQSQCGLPTVPQTAGIVSGGLVKMEHQAANPQQPQLQTVIQKPGIVTAQTRLAGNVVTAQQQDSPSQQLSVKVHPQQQVRTTAQVCYPQLLQGVQQIRRVLPSVSALRLSGTNEIKVTRPVHIMTFKQSTPLQRSAIRTQVHTSSQMLTHMSGGSVMSLQKRPQIVRLPSTSSGVSSAMSKCSPQLLSRVPEQGRASQKTCATDSQISLASSSTAGNRYYSINKILFTGEQQNNTLSITLPDTLPEISVDTISDTLQALSSPASTCSQLPLKEPVKSLGLSACEVISHTSAAQLPTATFSAVSIPSISSQPTKHQVPITAAQVQRSVPSEMTGFLQNSATFSSTPISSQAVQDCKPCGQPLPSFSSLFISNSSTLPVPRPMNSTLISTTAFISSSPVLTTSVGQGCGQNLTSGEKVEKKGAKKGKEWLATDKEKMMQLLKQAMTIKVEKKESQTGSGVVAANTHASSQLSVSSGLAPFGGKKTTCAPSVNLPSSLARPLFQKSPVVGGSSVNISMSQQPACTLLQTNTASDMSLLVKASVSGAHVTACVPSTTLQSTASISRQNSTVSTQSSTFIPSVFSYPSQHKILYPIQTADGHTVISTVQSYPTASAPTTATPVRLQPSGHGAAGDNHAVLSAQTAPCSLVNTVTPPSSSSVSVGPLKTFSGTEASKPQSAGKSGVGTVTSVPIPSSILPEGGGVIERATSGDQSIATYRCIICAKAFMTLDALRLHVKQICRPGLSQTDNVGNRMTVSKTQASEAGVETSTVFQCMRCFELCISEAGIRQHKLVCSKGFRPRAKPKPKPKVIDVETEEATEAKVKELLNKCLGENREKLLQEAEAQAAKQANAKKKPSRKRPSMEEEPMLLVQNISSESGQSAKKLRPEDDSSAKKPILEEASTLPIVTHTAVSNPEGVRTRYVNIPANISYPKNVQSLTSAGTFESTLASKNVPSLSNAGTFESSPSSTPLLCVTAAAATQSITAVPIADAVHLGVASESSSAKKLRPEDNLNAKKPILEEASQSSSPSEAITSFLTTGVVQNSVEAPVVDSKPEPEKNNLKHTSVEAPAKTTSSFQTGDECKSDGAKCKADGAIGQPSCLIQSVNTETAENLETSSEKQESVKEAAPSPQYQELSGSCRRFFKCLNCGQTLCSMQSLGEHWLECITKKPLLPTSESKEKKPEKESNSSKTMNSSVENTGCKAASLAFSCQQSANVKAAVVEASSKVSPVVSAMRCALEKDKCPAKRGKNGSVALHSSAQPSLAREAADRQDIRKLQMNPSSSESLVKKSIVLLEKINLPEKSNADAFKIVEHADSEIIFAETSEQLPVQNNNESSSDSLSAVSRKRSVLKKDSVILGKFSKQEHGLSPVKKDAFVKVINKEGRQGCRPLTVASPPQHELDKYCSVCKRFFSKHIYLVQHIASIHLKMYTLLMKGDETAYICDLCKQKLSSYNQCMSHVVIHSQTIIQKFDEKNSAEEVVSSDSSSSIGNADNEGAAGQLRKLRRNSVRDFSEETNRNNTKAENQDDSESLSTATKVNIAQSPVNDRRSSGRAAQKQALNKIYISSLGIANLVEPLKESNKRKHSSDESSIATTRPKRFRLSESMVEMDSEEDEENSEESSGEAGEDDSSARKCTGDNSAMSSATIHGLKAAKKASMGYCETHDLGKNGPEKSSVSIHCAQDGALPLPSHMLQSPFPSAPKKPSFIDSFLNFVSNRSPEAPLPLHQTRRRYSYLHDNLESSAPDVSQWRRHSCEEQHVSNSISKHQATTLPEPVPKPDTGADSPVTSRHMSSHGRSKMKSNDYENVYFYGEFEKQLTQHCKVNLGHRVRLEEMQLKPAGIHRNTTEDPVISVKDCIVNLGPKMNPATLISSVRCNMEPKKREQGGALTHSKIGTVLEPGVSDMSDIGEDTDSDTVVASCSALSPVRDAEDTISLDGIPLGMNPCPSSSGSQPAEGEVCVEATVSVLPLPTVFSPDADVAAIVSSMASQVAGESPGSPALSTACSSPTVETVTVSAIALSSQKTRPLLLGVNTDEANDETACEAGCVEIIDRAVATGDALSDMVACEITIDGVANGHCMADDVAIGDGTTSSDGVICHAMTDDLTTNDVRTDVTPRDIIEGDVGADVRSDDNLADNVTTVDITLDNVTTGDFTTDDVTAGDITTDNVATGEITADDTTADDITNKVMAVDLTTNGVTGGNSTAGNVTANDLTTDDATTDDIITDNAAADDLTADDVTAGDTTTGNVTTKDLTTEARTAEDITADGAAASDFTRGHATASDITAAAADDLVADCVTAGVITANAVCAGNITVKSETHGDIAVVNLIAGDITTDDLTLDDITRDNVTAGFITTDKTTADKVTAGELTEDDVTVHDITVDNITTDDITTNDVTAESAGNIVTNDVTADEVMAGNIMTDEVTLIADDSTADGAVACEKATDDVVHAGMILGDVTCHVTSDNTTAHDVAVDENAVDNIISVNLTADSRAGDCDAAVGMSTGDLKKTDSEQWEAQSEKENLPTVNQAAENCGNSVEKWDPIQEDEFTRERSSDEHENMKAQMIGILHQTDTYVYMSDEEEIRSKNVHRTDSYGNDINRKQIRDGGDDKECYSTQTKPHVLQAAQCEQEETCREDREIGSSPENSWQEPSVEPHETEEINCDEQQISAIITETIQPTSQLTEDVKEDCVSEYKEAEYSLQVSQKACEETDFDSQKCVIANPETEQNDVSLETDCSAHMLQQLYEVQETTGPKNQETALEFLDLKVCRKRKMDTDTADPMSNKIQDDGCIQKADITSVGKRPDVDNLQKAEDGEIVGSCEMTPLPLHNPDHLTSKDFTNKKSEASPDSVENPGDSDENLTSNQCSKMKFNETSQDDEEATTASSPLRTKRGEKGKSCEVSYNDTCSPAVQTSHVIQGDGWDDSEADITDPVVESEQCSDKELKEARFNDQQVSATGVKCASHTTETDLKLDCRGSDHGSVELKFACNVEEASKTCEPLIERVAVQEELQTDDIVQSVMEKSDMLEEGIQTVDMMEKSDMLEESIQTVVMGKSDMLEESIQTVDMMEKSDMLEESIQTVDVMEKSDMLEEGIQTVDVMEKSDMLEEGIQTVDMMEKSDMLEEGIQTVDVMEKSDMLEEGIQTVDVMGKSDILEEGIQTVDVMEKSDMLEEGIQTVDVMKKSDVSEERIQTVDVMEKSDLLEEGIQTVDVMKKSDMLEERIQTVNVMGKSDILEESIQTVGVMEKSDMLEEGIQTVEYCPGQNIQGERYNVVSEKASCDHLCVSLAEESCFDKSAQSAVKSDGQKEVPVNSNSVYHSKTVSDLSKDCECGRDLKYKVIDSEEVEQHVKTSVNEMVDEKLVIDTVPAKDPSDQTICDNVQSESWVKIGGRTSATIRAENSPVLPDSQCEGSAALGIDQSVSISVEEHVSVPYALDRPEANLLESESLGAYQKLGSIDNTELRDLSLDQMTDKKSVLEMILISDEEECNTLNMTSSSTDSQSTYPPDETVCELLFQKKEQPQESVEREYVPDRELSEQSGKTMFDQSESSVNITEGKHAEENQGQNTHSAEMENAKNKRSLEMNKQLDEECVTEEVLSVEGTQIRRVADRDIIQVSDHSRDSALNSKSSEELSAFDSSSGEKEDSAAFPVAVQSSSEQDLNLSPVSDMNLLQKSVNPGFQSSPESKEKLAARKIKTSVISSDGDNIAHSEAMTADGDDSDCDSWDTCEDKVNIIAILDESQLTPASLEEGDSVCEVDDAKPSVVNEHELSDHLLPGSSRVQVLETDSHSCHLLPLPESLQPKEPSGLSVCEPLSSDSCAQREGQEGCDDVQSPDAGHRPVHHKSDVEEDEDQWKTISGSMNNGFGSPDLSGVPYTIAGQCSNSLESSHQPQIDASVPVDPSSDCGDNLRDQVPCGLQFTVVQSINSAVACSPGCQQQRETSDLSHGDLCRESPNHSADIEEKMEELSGPSSPDVAVDDLTFKQCGGGHQELMDKSPSDQLGTNQPVANVQDVCSQSIDSKKHLDQPSGDFQDQLESEHASKKQENAQKDFLQLGDQERSASPFHSLLMGVTTATSNSVPVEVSEPVSEMSLLNVLIPGNTSHSVCAEMKTCTSDSMPLEVADCTSNSIRKSPDRSDDSSVSKLSGKSEGRGLVMVEDNSLSKAASYVCSVQTAVPEKSADDTDPETDLPELCIIPDPQGTVIKSSKIARKVEKEVDIHAPIENSEEDKIISVTDSYEVTYRPLTKAKTKRRPFRKTPLTYCAIKAEKVEVEEKEDSQAAQLESPTSPRKPLVGVKSLRHVHNPKPFVWDVDGEEDSRKKICIERSLKALRSKVGMAPFSLDSNSSDLDKTAAFKGDSATREGTDPSAEDHYMRPLQAFRQKVGSRPFSWDSDDADMKNSETLPGSREENAQKIECDKFGTQNVCQEKHQDSVGSDRMSKDRFGSSVNKNQEDGVQSGLKSEKCIKLKTLTTSAQGRLVSRFRETVRSGSCDKVLLVAARHGSSKCRSMHSRTERPLRKSRSCDIIEYSGDLAECTPGSVSSRAEKQQQVTATRFKQKTKSKDEPSSKAKSVKNITKFSQQFKKRSSDMLSTVSARSAESFSQSAVNRKRRLRQCGSTSNDCKTNPCRTKKSEQNSARSQYRQQTASRSERQKTQDNRSNVFFTGCKNSKTETEYKNSSRKVSSDTDIFMHNKIQTRSKESLEKAVNREKSTRQGSESGMQVRNQKETQLQQELDTVTPAKWLRSKETSPNKDESNSSTHIPPRSVPGIQHYGPVNESFKSFRSCFSASRSNRDRTPVNDQNHGSEKAGRSQADLKDCVRYLRNRFLYKPRPVNAGICRNNESPKEKAVGHKTDGSVARQLTDTSKEPVSKMISPCSRSPHKELKITDIANRKSQVVPSSKRVTDCGVHDSETVIKTEKQDLSAHTFAESDTLNESLSDFNPKYLTAMVRRRQQPASWRTLNPPTPKKARIPVSEPPQYEIIRVEPLTTETFTDQRKTRASEVEQAPRTVHTRVSVDDIAPVLQRPESAKTSGDQKWQINRHFTPSDKKKKTNPHFPFSFKRARAKTQTN